MLISPARAVLPQPLAAKPRSAVDSIPTQVEGQGLRLKSRGFVAYDTDPWSNNPPAWAELYLDTTHPAGSPPDVRVKRIAIYKEGRDEPVAIAELPERYVVPSPTDPTITQFFFNPAVPLSVVDRGARYTVVATVAINGRDPVQVRSDYLRPLDQGPIR